MSKKTKNKTNKLPIPGIVPFDCDNSLIKESVKKINSICRKAAYQYEFTFRIINKNGDEDIFNDYIEVDDKGKYCTGADEYDNLEGALESVIRMIYEADESDGKIKEISIMEIKVEFHEELDTIVYKSK